MRTLQRSLDPGREADRRCNRFPVLSALSTASWPDLSSSYVSLRSSPVDHPRASGTSLVSSLLTRSLQGPTSRTRFPAAAPPHPTL